MTPGPAGPGSSPLILRGGGAATIPETFNPRRSFILNASFPSPALIACPHCGRQGRAPANAAGRLARCPGCKQTFAAGPIPDGGPTPAADAPILAGLAEDQGPGYRPAEPVVALPFWRVVVWVVCLFGMLLAAGSFAGRSPGIALFAGDELFLKLKALAHAAETLIWMVFLYAVARGFDAMTRR